MLWAIDFQFDSTVDGKAVKIASMIGEHTRESMLNIVEPSITGERLVEVLKADDLDVASADERRGHLGCGVGTVAEHCR